MVAELGLRARLPDFSPNPARTPKAMASPVVADAFMQPPMANWEDNTTPLQSYVDMGTVGIFVLQAVRVAGGRLVQGIYNRITKQVQLIYDQRGELVDFPLQQQQQQPTATDYNIDDEQPTTPRPPQANGENVGEHRTTGDSVDDVMSSATQNLGTTKLQSPATPVATQFQDTTDDSDNGPPQMTDEQTKRERETGLGWGSGVLTLGRLPRRC